MDHNPCPECEKSGGVQCQPHKCQDLIAWQELNRYAETPKIPTTKVKSYKCNLCRDWKSSIHFDIKPNGKPMSICIACHKKLNEVEELAKNKAIKPTAAPAKKPTKPKVIKIETKKEIKPMAPEPKVTKNPNSDDFLIEQMFTDYPKAFEALKNRSINSVRTIREQVVYEAKMLSEGFELVDPDCQINAGS